MSRFRERSGRDPIWGGGYVVIAGDPRLAYRLDPRVLPLT